MENIMSMRNSTKTRRRGGAYWNRAPLIAPSAVKEFLSRKLDDFRWLKEVPRAELLKAMPFTDFVTEPRNAQLVCTFIGQHEPRFLFLLAMGAGKTKIILDLIRYRKYRGELRAALVLVPNLINLYSWREQATLHAPDLSVTVLEGSKEERAALLDATSSDLYVLNYAGLAVYTTELRAGGGMRRGGRFMVREKVEAFSSLFNFVVFDEIHLMGDQKTLTFSLCQHLSMRADFVYGLTGTPFGRDPHRLWSEFRVVDRGATLGASIALYRAAFFIAKPNYWSGIEYVFDRRKHRLLHQMIQHRSIRYTEAELGDVPQTTYQVIRIDMAPQQRQYYDNILKEIRDAEGDPNTRTNSYIRTRQTTAGFLTLRGEDSARIEVAFDRSAKVEGLMDLLYQILSQEDSKVVVFHEYIYSGVLIAQKLDKKGIRFAGVGHNFKNPGQQIEKFVVDPKCKVFLANWQAGGTGVDGLQRVARYMVFFESPSSPDRRKQCETRLIRAGQKHHVLVYDLVCAGTVDEKILRYLEEGKDLFQAICEGKETAL